MATPGTVRPLHVLVAEALGWTDLYESTSLTGLIRWVGVEPHGGLRLEVPRYDTSWCSSGVLVERFGMSLAKGDDWGAYKDGSVGQGRTPCEAIARLIVELHREGKLTK